MDQHPTDTGPDNRVTSRGRGRRVVAALVVAVALAAVPAGVALAGGSDGSDGSAGGAANSAAQRGGGDRGDCPERDRQGGQENQDSAQI